jgi:hypothetical protein
VGDGTFRSDRLRTWCFVDRVSQYIGTVKHTKCTLCIQIVVKYQPPHTSSITCSSLGGAAQKTIGVLLAHYVCWLLPGLELNSDTSSTPILVAAPPEDEQVMLETCTG